MSSKASTIRCLITAGPTREYFDPVRFLSNPSSGKMGYALAQAALDLGWSVDLVSGPVHLEEPSGAVMYPVITGEEMYHQVDALFDVCDVCIMTAAVSDFKPKQYHQAKQKKAAHPLLLEVEPVVDILKTVSQRKKDQLIMGFAAETENLEEYAKAKLYSKNCDWVVANKIGGHNSAFGSDDNKVILLGKDGSIKALGPDSKINIAEQLLSIVSLCI